MASRWSKRRKLHAEVDQYLHVINQHCLPDVEQHGCNNAMEVVAIGSSELVVSANCSETTCEQLRHAEVDENILSICPDIQSLPIFYTNTEFRTCLSTSDFETSDYSVDSKSTSDTELSDLRADLTTWAVEHRITHVALNQLLLILRTKLNDLPKDARTLLNTCSIVPIVNLAGGSYCHIGIEKAIQSVLVHSCQGETNELKIQINIDGLPLQKSSSSQLWPILGQIENYSDFGLSRKQAGPFVIGLYHGYSKPLKVEEYLQQFVVEAQHLETAGLVHNEQCYRFKINSVVCDMPARSFVRCVKGHGAYGGCDRCIQKGVYMSKVTYPDCNAQKRTDESFKQMADERHHLQVSPLSSLSIGLVTSFPLDYMHLVCLGVVRKLVSLWLTGPLKTRLGRLSVTELNEKMCMLRERIPVEIRRKPRSFSEFERWKAVEFRQLLLYTGSVILCEILPIELYQNFLLLSVAITIFLHPSLCKTMADYGHHLLISFVEHFGQLYGMDKITYNIHGLIHLVDDVKKFGALDNVSAFPFENFLGKLKKFIRKPAYPLQQVIRRLSEVTEDQQESATLSVAKGLHFNGPVPAGLSVVNQFSEIKVRNFTIKLTSADRFVMVENGELIEVQNIVVNDIGVFGLIFKRCKDTSSFFSYPLSSKDIGIIKIDHIGSHLHYCNLIEVTKKYIVLPHKDNIIGIPLLHTNQE